MSLSVQFQQQFRTAAEAVKADPMLQEKPTIVVESQTLAQVLAPVREMLDEDAVYGQYETQVYHQLRELRQMCLEAQVAHTTSNEELKSDRNVLLNALQGFVDSASKAEGGAMQVDFDYLFDLPSKTDVMRSNATIYREFMRSPEVADILEQVADNVEAAHQRHWLPDPEQDVMPVIDIDCAQELDDDDSVRLLNLHDQYNHQEIA